MVGKTYLRYVDGPQGGAIVSSGALSVAAAVALPTYAAPSLPSRAAQSRQRPPPPSAMLFAPSLEAVRVFSLRSGALQHTLIPADVKMPLEVTALRLAPLEPFGSPIDRGGWLLLVGYHNGHTAVFACGPTNNYGLPVCRFFALGHRADTAVLALAVDTRRGTMCSGGQDTDVAVWDLATHEAAFRLRGHRGGVVGVEFVPGNDRIVVTGAADGLVKVWDISVRQCVQTLVASDAQVSAIAMDAAGRRLFCGIRESYVKVFNTEALTNKNMDLNSHHQQQQPYPLDNHSGVNDSENIGEVLDHGSIARKLQKPITSLTFSDNGAFLLACTSKSLEVFRVLSREDVRRKAARKRKRREETMKKSANNNIDSQVANLEDANEDDPEELEENGQSKRISTAAANPNSDSTNVAAATAAEEIVLMRTFFLDQKIRSACFVPHTASSTHAASSRSSLHIAVTFNNNTVRTYTTEVTKTEMEGAATVTLTDLATRHSMEEKGHHNDVRALVFVDDDTALLSLSAEKLMMWNVSVLDNENPEHTESTRDFYDAREANVARVHLNGSLTCTGQVPLDNAVTAAAISSSLCCVGLSDGTILLADVPAASVVFAEPSAHIGGVKNVATRPDKSGFVSVGADRRLITWTLALLQGDQKKKDGAVGKELNDHGPQLMQTMEMELTESPLFLSFSPDQRFAAVGLQNTNIQLFFADTMKPYLTLFGHKLPPIAAAFSSDGTLIASVGMDKSLRFWGTDFGDCHRAIHAHDDYVTHVEFLRGTHQLFTVSLDGSVKHWDGDNWTMVQVARHHQRGVWAVATASNGTCVVTAGADRCLRCLLRTSDIVFPHEEAERAAQAAMDEEAARRAAAQAASAEARAGPDGSWGEARAGGEATSATSAAAERVMEALDVVSVEAQRRANPEELADPHPMLLGKSPGAYLWGVVESVRPSELPHALAALTSTHVDALLSNLEEMLRAGEVLNHEIAAKILLVLVAPAMGSQVARAAAVAGEVSEAHGARRLVALRKLISEGLDRAVGRMDYNVAGLQFVRQYVEENDKARFFDLSKIQGHKKKYHTRALDVSAGKEDRVKKN